MSHILNSELFFGVKEFALFVVSLVGGVFCFTYYKFLNGGNPAPEAVIMWQGLGVAVIVYGIGRIITITPRFEKKRREKLERQQLLDALCRLEQQNRDISNQLTQLVENSKQDQLAELSSSPEKHVDELHNGF